jgi:hypothetical protein
VPTTPLQSDDNWDMPGLRGKGCGEQSGSRHPAGNPRHLWLPCKTHDPLHALVGPGSTSARPILEQRQRRPCPTLSQRGTHGRPCLPRRHSASRSPDNLPPRTSMGSLFSIDCRRTHLPLPCGEGMKSRRTVEPSRCASSGAPGRTLSSLLRSGVINDQGACLDGDFVRTHRTPSVGLGTSRAG